MKSIILTLLSFATCFAASAQNKSTNCEEVNALVKLIQNDPAKLLGEKIVEVESSIWGKDYETIYYKPSLNFQNFVGKAYKDNFGTYVVYEVVVNDESKDKTYQIAKGLYELFDQCLNEDWTYVHPEQKGSADKYFFVQAEDKDKGDNIKDFVKPYISFSIYNYKTFTLNLSFLDPLAK
ncbi:MAG: hypothetical protein H6579_04140 [Chitinophagales bacterium]|nr:hypothetical protein [Chitinophagales bacterium]